MYFKGSLQVDPSQLTKIEKKKPEKAFKKLLYIISQGGIADKIERETFTALSILDQFNNVFQNLGINNAIRLTQDNIDFYFDKEGKKDDLNDALDAYDLNADAVVSQYFNVLLFVLEHVDKSFNYLIEMKINRTHKVGAYPIEIKINGVLNEFKTESAEELKEVKERMAYVFESQKAHDTFMKEKNFEFEAFLRKLEQTVMKFIPIDDIKVKFTPKVVMTKEKVQKTQYIGVNDRAEDPVYHGYYGLDNFLIYAMLWSTMCHDNHIHIHDAEIMSETGDMLGSIGEEGIDIAEAGFFDTDIPVEDRLEGFNEFDNPVDESDMFGDLTDEGSADWFDMGDTSFDMDFDLGDF